MNAIGWTYVNKGFLISNYFIILLCIILEGRIPLAIDKVFIIDFMTCFLQRALSPVDVKSKGPTCHLFFFAFLKWFYKYIYNILCRCFKSEVKVTYACMDYGAIIG